MEGVYSPRADETARSVESVVRGEGGEGHASSDNCGSQKVNEHDRAIA